MATTGTCQFKNNMNKKILLIIGILVAVGAALALVFFDPTTDSSSGEERFSLREFLPFGRGDNASPSDISNESEGNTNIETSSRDREIPRLRKISTEPVAGFAVFDQGSTTLIRFVEKGTGNVYEANSENEKIERLTNTTIPKIVRSFWLPGGSGFLAQTLLPESEVIETSFVKLAENTATSSEELTPFTTTISKLPTGIEELSIKPDGSKIFYYTTAGGVSRWFMSNPDGTQNSELLSHPLTEWSPKWISNNIVEMKTKNSAFASVYAYDFNVNNKTLSSKKLNQPISETFEEKCVAGEEDVSYCAIPKQSISRNIIDDWYKGILETDDIIEMADLENDVFYRLADLSDLSGEKIDVVDIAISPDETHLVFRNKLDGFLWVFRIEE